MKTIAIIGAGELGFSLGKVLQKNDANNVIWWDKDATKVPNQLPIAETITSAEVIFLCIPSWSLRDCFKEIKELVAGKTVVAFAKGIESQDHYTTNELMKEELDSTVKRVVVGGPMLAEEIELGLPTRGIIGSENGEGQIVADLYAGSNLSFALTDDMQGVCLAGVLKNVYAVGLGIAHALQYGSNFNGWLITEGIEEMSQLIPKLNGRAETAYSLAGVGDLITTGFSSYSRNRTCGEQLVNSGTCSMDSEGMVSLPFLLDRLGDIELPLYIAMMKRILIDKSHAKKEFDELVKRIS